MTNTEVISSVHAFEGLHMYQWSCSEWHIISHVKRHPVQVKSSSDYIGDISLAANGMHLSVAAASSGLLWLDCRNVQNPVASLRCSAPARRCRTDGQVVLAALEDGKVNSICLLLAGWLTQPEAHVQLHCHSFLVCFGCKFACSYQLH